MKKKNLIFFLVLIIIIFFTSILFFQLEDKKIPLVSDVWESENEIKGVLINGTTIKVEVVDTLVSRIRGLSGRKNLGPSEGMLFVFNELDFHGIWMKDMNFPIDIVWIGEHFFVVDLKKSVQPETFPEVFKPKSPAKYVLEIPEGFLEENSVEIGSEVKFLFNYQ